MACQVAFKCCLMDHTDQKDRSTNIDAYIKVSSYNVGGNVAATHRVVGRLDRNPEYPCSSGKFVVFPYIT